MVTKLRAAGRRAEGEIGMKRILFISLFILLTTAFSGCSASEKLYQNGRKSLVDENYEAAAEYFTAAISKNSNRAEYYIDYAMTLIKLKQYEEALQEFDKAYVNKDIIIINQNNKRIYRGKGIAYYYMRDYQRAIDEFDKALEINALAKLDLDILYYIGSAQMAIGRYEDAIKTYENLITRNDKDALSYSNRALCYQRIGDYESSLKDYDMAISLEPNNYSHYFGKYFLLQGSGDLASAKEVLNKAAEIEGTSDEDRYNMAKLHYYREEYDTALSELENGITNGFSEANYYIGEIYRIKKDYQKAIYYYKLFLEEGEINSPNVYNQIAVCLIRTGEYQDALTYLEQGKTYPYADRIQALYRNEVVAYECLGRFDEADQKLKEYLSLFPKDEEAVKEAEFIATRVMEPVLPDASE
jgi:tetratricopeptide (TPR) repeat protein